VEVTRSWESSLLQLESFFYEDKFMEPVSANTPTEKQLNSHTNYIISYCHWYSVSVNTFKILVAWLHVMHRHITGYYFLKVISVLLLHQPILNALYWFKLILSRGVSEFRQHVRTFNTGINKVPNCGILFPVTNCFIIYVASWSAKSAWLDIGCILFF
jgi:hypothetical protein